MRLTQELKEKLNSMESQVLIRKIKTLYDYKLKEERVFYCDILDKLIKDKELEYCEEIAIDKLENE